MLIEPHADLPTNLHKYASPHAVRAILENGTLQFSRPNTFDDDFDMRINLAMNIDEEIVIEGALDQIWEAAYGPVSIPAGNKFGRAILAMRYLFPGRPNREKFIEFMRPKVVESIRRWEGDLRRLCDIVAEQCSNHKVLCLSASPIVAPMWGAYAGNRQGAVLQFAPNSEDSFFQIAKPVNYVNQVPVLFDNTGLIDWLSGRRALDEKESLHELFLYTKTEAWAVQEEWRIVAGDGWEPNNIREFVPFVPIDLQTLIFGSQAEPEFCEEIAAIVRERYPHCNLHQLQRSLTTLNYEVVDL